LSLKNEKNIKKNGALVKKKYKRKEKNVFLHLKTKKQFKSLKTEEPNGQ